MSSATHIVVVTLDALVVAYMGVFFAVNLIFVVLSFRSIRQELAGEQIRPSAGDAGAHFLPSITLLVPAYNEEVTIAQSVRSLLRLDYPNFEIVICNDGSRDGTVDVLRREFQFVRTELEYGDRLGTSPIRAFYVSRASLPPGLRRLILIDKDNGGKADALNAAINAAQGDFVTSMDADSLLAPDALLRAVRPITADPAQVVAVGVQVGLTNGSRVEDGRVVDMRLPSSLIGRFQVVEYMRSFAQGRMAFSSMNSLLVLSGVFALLRRDLVLAIGGFLTKYMRSRVGLEYCGKEPHTVCEDMEIVVRMHRYLLDGGGRGRVAMLSFPTAWTEAPENYRDLGKQRARWYRGLLEVMSYHRAMIFAPRFRQIGLFALPYQLIFEVAAPPIELCGYILFCASALLGTLSLSAILAFLALAAAINVCLSTMSILLCVYSDRATRTRTDGIALFSYNRIGDLALLFVFGLLSNFGYRQFLVTWQLRGLRDFLAGKKEWDKFARKGFAVGGRAT